MVSLTTSAPPYATINSTGLVAGSQNTLLFLQERLIFSRFEPENVARCRANQLLVNLALQKALNIEVYNAT